MQRLKGLTALFLIFGLKAWGSEYSLNSQVTNKKSTISTSIENSSFTLSEGKISGSSIKIDFSHYFAPKVNLEVYLSSALNIQGGVQSSFTGVGGYVYYTVLGNSYETQTNVGIAQQTIISDRNNKINHFQLGAGLDQFLLNGTKSVYSASGLGIGAVYRFNVFGYDLKASARYSTMTSGTIKLQGLFYGIGINFNL